MGLVKFGNGIAAVSGKIGGTVFARNRAGAYARNWTKPVSTPTPAQSSARALLGSNSAGWSTLTAEQRADWNNKVQDLTRLNRFGESYTPTGRQVYIELNQNLALIGEAQIGDAPSDFAPPEWNAGYALDPAGNWGIANTAGAITLLSLAGSVYDGTEPATSHIRATTAFPNVKFNYSNQFRGVASGDAGAGLAIATEWNARFGDPAVTEGQVIMISHSLVFNSTGSRTAELIFPLVVPAPA